MQVINCVKIEKTFKLDEEVYYDSFEIRKNGDKSFSIKLSENLIIFFERRHFILENIKYVNMHIYS